MSPSARAATPVYYVAMGDSLSLGVGADPPSNSYVNQIYQRELARFPDLVLVNYSCGNVTNGEKTGTMLNGPYGCTGPGDARGDGPKPASQLAAVETFLQEHPGQVAFLTIDIGANDLILGDSEGRAEIKKNLPVILSRLSKADPGVKIFGANYYNTNLLNWLDGSTGELFARFGAGVARSFNAIFDQIYTAAGVPHAGVAAAFDSDNFGRTGTYNGVTLPQNVANVCNWTLICSNGDPHPNSDGHGVIANAFVPLIDGYPVAPAAPTATTRNGSAVVSWKAPSPANGPPVTGYVVTPYLVKPHDLLVAQAPVTFANAVTTQTVLSLANAKTYRFKVAAVNSVGSGVSSVASRSVKIGTPAAPKSVKATRNAGGLLRVTFTTPAGNGAAITSTAATCASSNGGVPKTATAKGSPITVAGLTGGKTYTCTVKATNTRGTGPPSAKSAAVKA